jgi:hypothetical protein
MNRGQVYVWNAQTQELRMDVVHLKRLVGKGKLDGKYVIVENAGEMNFPNPVKRFPQTRAIGNAAPDARGDFIFDPCGGGRRIDRLVVAGIKARSSYIEASHFGEVNTYYHLDKVAHYLAGLLSELKAKPIPKLVAKVTAHGAAVERDGLRDGAFRKNKWFPFQGAHYRLPGTAVTINEHSEISPAGEIHFGPGRRLTKGGKLHDLHGGPYRANASHNAAIIYHEYGHHLTRHTADFKANELRDPLRQSNGKTALDEAYCDYFAATMLESPDIWLLHHRHDANTRHPRSLASVKTMLDFDDGESADEHLNGTIFAAALWDLRSRLGRDAADRLVVQSLLALGASRSPKSSPKATAKCRESFEVGMNCLVAADSLLFGGSHRQCIRAIFEARGIPNCSRRNLAA